MSIGKIPQIKFVIRPDDKEVQNHISERTKECLEPIGTAGEEDVLVIDLSKQNDVKELQNDVLKQITAIIAIQVESTKETNKISKLKYDRKVEKDNNKKDGIRKLHLSVKRTFLVAASVDGKEMADDLPESCKSFLTRTRLQCRTRN